MDVAIDPAAVPSRLLSNGMTIPAIGLGTFGNDRFGADQVAAAVEGAIEAGYRLIDCAAAYGNEPEIGRAFERLFRRGVVRRDELVVSSKVWNNRHGPGEVIEACDQTLRDLRLDYLDLYLVHWPFPNDHPPGAAPDSRQPDAQPFSIDDYMTCYRQMEQLVRSGKVRAIGTSNMTIRKLEALLALCETVPVVNQMELHPAFQQPALFRYCVNRAIQPVGFSPLGSPGRPERDRAPNDVSALDMEEIRAIAAAHRVHPAHVCLKWAVQRGQIPIPFSVYPEEYVSNLRTVTEDPLTEAEMSSIEIADRNCRLIKGVVFLWESAPSWRALWDEETDADS
ncbi:aldo/keto reductase [Salinispira pacifica]